MQKEYAQAIDRLVRERGMKEDEIFKKLRAHLAETGRLKLLPQIAEELRTLEARRALSAPELEVATEAERGEAEAAAKAQGITAKATVNPHLIHGWRLRANGRITDRSAKRVLIDIYRKAIA